MEDTFQLDDGSYEARTAADELERAGHVARMVSRVWIDPIVRQLLGYMLREESWLVDKLIHMAVRPDGVLVAVISEPQAPRGPVQAFFQGPPPPPARHVVRYTTADIAVRALRDVAARAELSAADTAWLLELPRVRTIRAGIEE